jgi:hypothetical protein
MKTGAVIAIVAGVLVALYFAVSRGLIGSGVAVKASGGVVAPQPAANYSGYLAATTAPQVSGILNTLLSGVNSAAHSWLAPSGAPSSPAPQQGASPTSPSLFAQPSGPAPQPTSYVADTTLVGPQIDPVMQYSATSGSAFDYSGLAADNSFDVNASLEDYAV